MSGAGSVPTGTSRRDRPITVLMFLAAIVVVGVIAQRTVPLLLLPPGFVENSISVSVPVPDSTPLEVMEEVAEPAEELFRTIPGISGISSWSGSDFCQLEVQYAYGGDGEAIYADLRDRMERLLPSLPEGADRYRIFRFNLDTDLAVMQCAVMHSEDVESPETLLENVVRPRLESLEGVARARVQGIIGRQVAIELLPERVAAHSVDVRALVERLRGENLLLGAGPVDDGGRRLLVRVSRRFRDLEEIRAFPVSGSLSLADIATVEFRRGVEDQLVRVDGDLCHVVDVHKESDANTVDVCRRLRALYEEELANDPRLAGFRFHVFLDQGEIIREQIGQLESTCLWGGALAILVLLVFIRRLLPTLFIASAIPVSLLMAVSALYFRGGTFNFLSITGLTLAIGMLIDNAIVVSENILRHRELGLPAPEAARRGSREVALAVTLATLTTVAVFAPLMFLGGDSPIRVALREVGFPVCESLLASLVVALIFIPTGAARVFGGEIRSAPAAGGRRTRRRRAFRRALAWSLRHRVLACCVFAGVLASSQFPLAGIQKQGESGTPSSDHYLQVDLPEHSSLVEADETMERIRLALEPLRESAGVETIVTIFDEEDGFLMLFLRDGVLSPREEFQRRMKEHLPVLPGVDYRSRWDGSEAGGLRIEVSAAGRDPVTLAAILEELGERLRRAPGVLAVDTPADDTREEVAVVVERERAQRFEVAPAQVSGLIGWMLRGAPLPDFEAEGEELPLWIRFAEEEFDSLGDLDRIDVYGAGGRAISLASLARFEMSRTLPGIRREDRRVQSRLSVTIDPQAEFGAATREVYRRIADTELPTGYTLFSEDGSEDFEEGLEDVVFAGLLGLVLIFGLMGVLFESVLLPLAVLCCVPFLFVGSFWSCYLFETVLTEEALVGFVILLGVVVNNGIVLVDCIHRFRADGMTRSQAIIEGSIARLRPVWMTSLTTIVGLLPLVLMPEQGGGMSFRAIGVVVLGGLTSATIFTTIVVPLFYAIFEDFGTWLRTGRVVSRRGR